ncbi:methanol--corrinoid methyltransferase [Synergistales bacterium]|nr:methanol--corrinoid methyltransferase [Synergistales bacterium]
MARNAYKSPAYTKLDEFVFGTAKNPVKLKNGMVIGGGTIYPELNFTVPTMKLTDDTWSDAIACYTEIITKTCERARELEVPGFVAEIETLPEMTFKPKWAIEVCKVVVDIIKEHESKYGIKGAVRITPNDNREGDAVDHMWRGPRWDETMEAFEGSAKAGADFLAIETIGGKEVHDDALMFCNIKQDVFAYAALACRDMEKIWSHIVDIAGKFGGVPAGDTACGLANTAMVLAEKNYIPRVFAAADRVMSSVRSLVAMEVGAKGPDKDCGYEGPYVKAISGNPISMEGRVASCAHLSACGNIAVCVADLWSNESVQNIQLLSGIAPVASFETLAYDCRLMNTAKKKSNEAALLLRDLNADSDSPLDPHAYILRPDVVLEIAKGITDAGDDYYLRTKAAAALSLGAIDKGVKDGKLKINAKEQEWLKKLIDEVASLPKTLDELAEQVLPECDKLDPKKYDLPY